MFRSTIGRRFSSQSESSKPSVFWKEGHNWKNWKRRYYKILKGSLSYYENEVCVTLKGQIPLKSIELKRGDPATTTTKLPITLTGLECPIDLKILETGILYRLVFDTETDAKHFVETLERACPQIEGLQVLKENMYWAGTAHTVSTSVHNDSDDEELDENDHTKVDAEAILKAFTASHQELKQKTAQKRASVWSEIAELEAKQKMEQEQKKEAEAATEAEQLRLQEEQEREKESARLLAEAAAAKAEQLRLQEEQEREKESARLLAEAAAAKAEQLRLQEEQEREKESIRLLAEAAAATVSANTLKLTAEEIRTRTNEKEEEGATRKRLEREQLEARERKLKSMQDATQADIERLKAKEEKLLVCIHSRTTTFV